MATVRLAKMLGLDHLKVWQGSLKETMGISFYDLRANSIDGQPFDLKQLKGSVVMVSNVASRCKWTNDNYDRFVEYDKKYRGKLQILAFPSNEFGHQEPGNYEDILEFVKPFHVKFHMMEKSFVNGPRSNQVFRALKKATGSEDVDINWNFETKFLIAKEGEHVERFSNAANASDLVPFLDRLVGELDPVEQTTPDDDDAPVKSAASFVYTG